MDVEEQIECLNRALRLQHRSVLQYSLIAGSVIGLEYQAHADKMREHAAVRARGRHPAGREDHRARRRADHRGGADDVHRPTRPRRSTSLIDCEGETLEALQAAIEPTGREAASEAVEHRLEHMIMRKQEQVDYLLQGRRRP